MHRSDVIRHEQAGGGGYGDPHERAPEAVLADVLDGKVSRAFAEKHFGVAIGRDSVDEEATRRLRGAREPA